MYFVLSGGGGHSISVTVFQHGVKNKLFATEQVQSALQTVQQNRYSPHYKLCYKTGTVCITNCGTEQVQSALPEVQHSGHILGKDVVKLGQRVDVLVAPVQEVLPVVSQHLQTEHHTHDHISTLSVRR